MSDRYTVGSVTGWKIDQAHPARAGDSKRTPTVIWYVHDSALCHRTVKEFRRRGAHHAEPEQAARALAARMNAEDGAT